MFNYKDNYYKIISELKKKAISHYKNKLISVVLFGSVAKDTFSPESDIDILFVLSRIKGSYKDFEEYFDFIEEKLYFYKKLKKENIFIRISPIFKSKNSMNLKMPFLWGCDFKILYDKENFFSNFYKKLKNYIEKNLILHKNPFPYFEIKNDK